MGRNESLLARVTEVIQRQNGGAELLLDIRGKPLQVQASIGETKLQAGDWIKVLRAGNELQLMGKLAAAPEVSLAQASTASSAREEPPNAGQLLRILAGMLNRITVNQLHTQVLNARGGTDAGAPTNTLLLELPWMNPQQQPKLAQLRIEQHPGPVATKLQHRLVDTKA